MISMFLICKVINGLFGFKTDASFAAYLKTGYGICFR